MGVFSWLKSFKTLHGSHSSRRKSVLAPLEGNLPPSQDTLAAIEELSQVVKDNPDSIEIYLALGNLYRSQGEIERAVQIRNSLIVRQNLDPQLKAKALYELGRDYKRAGFLDRAQHALEQTRNLVGDDPALLEELARLAADSRDYEKATQYYSHLGNAKAEAHYMVKLSRRAWLSGDKNADKKWLNKAFKAYPGSVEAWLEVLLRSFKKQHYSRLAKDLEQALDKVPRQLIFVLLEGILDFPQASRKKIMGENALSNTQQIELKPDFCHTLLPILEKQPEDVLIYYYGAWLAKECGDYDASQTWLEKTLLLDSDFWPARLELLASSIHEQTLTPQFKVQLEFFLAKARRVKRFVCLKCGLKREQIFFVCPRCQSWHSNSFRMSIND